VASPLTSLPEVIGGGRNWDYRFCWLRDSALTLYALSVLGYSGEAGRCGDYLMVACHASYPRLQIMYGIDAEAELPERSLDHLEGYAGSRPVRIGNGAYQQTQHDVPGEILDWAHLQRALGSRPGRRTRNFLAELADRTAENWSEPDSGLWEMRGKPMNHVYSKVMTWVTFDRATTLTGSRKQKRTWRRTADEIVRTVLSRGIDPKLGILMQSFESADLDASLLAIPFTGFPIDDGLFGRTVDAIRDELSEGPFVYRYRSDDQLEGREGAFLLCSFWLVDAMLWLGREKEARARFDELLAAANDVGLYPEEIDPDSRMFLGNFPQAFTHLAIVRTASLFELFHTEGLNGIRGNNTSRAKRLIGATAGPMALWEAFRQSGRLGRFRSSKQSMLKS
ncbi:MAG TPA: glycoside hydrolase family 15 protein, partial [Thermoanaerobaculia bacterium]|nr:glycoside hydrolase family 15 protein [Thermoanaerobaculia bacterium]